MAVFAWHFGRVWIIWIIQSSCHFGTFWNLFLRSVQGHQNAPYSHYSASLAFWACSRAHCCSAAMFTCIRKLACSAEHHTAKRRGVSYSYQTTGKQVVNSRNSILWTWCLSTESMSCESHLVVCWLLFLVLTMISISMSMSMSISRYRYRQIVS